MTTPRAVTTYYSADGQPLMTLTSRGAYPQWVAAMIWRPMEIVIVDECPCLWTYERLMSKTVAIQSA